MTIVPLMVPFFVAGVYLWNMGPIYNWLYDKIDSLNRRNYKGGAEDLFGFEDEEISITTGFQTGLLYFLGLVTLPMLAIVVEVVIAEALNW